MEIDKIILCFFLYNIFNKKELIEIIVDCIIIINLIFCMLMYVVNNE